MIGAVVAFAVLLVSLGQMDQSWFSPDTKYEHGLSKDEPPDCRPLNQRERYSRGLGNRGKASTFSVHKGGYVCEREIFDYGERDSFFQFVAAHAPPRAEQVAEQVQRLRGEKPQGPLYVRVESGYNELNTYLHRTYTTAIAETSGQAVSVARRVGSEQTLPRLEVAVRRTDRAHLLFDVRYVQSNGKGGVTWQKL